MCFDNLRARIDCYQHMLIVVLHLSVDHIKLKKQFLQDITNLVLVIVMKIFG